MKQYSLYIVVSASLMIMICIIYQGTYSFFTSAVAGTGNTNNNTSTVDTDDLTDIILTGEAQITNTNMIPGETVSSTINLQNNNNIAICYTLNWESVSNTFVNTQDLILTMEDKDGNNVLDSVTFPTTTTVLKSGLKIEANTTDTYTIKVHYQNTLNNQIEDMGKSFSGTINGVLSDCE